MTDKQTTIDKCIAAGKVMDEQSIPDRGLVLDVESSTMYRYEVRKVFPASYVKLKEAPVNPLLLGVFHD